MEGNRELLQAVRLCCLISLWCLSACYYGPGVSAKERRAVSESARKLSLVPVAKERAQHFGSIVGGGILAPLVFRVITNSSASTETEPVSRITDLDLEKTRLKLKDMEQELRELGNGRGAYED